MEGLKESKIYIHGLLVSECLLEFLQGTKQCAFEVHFIVSFLGWCLVLERILTMDDLVRIDNFLRIECCAG